MPIKLDYTLRETAINLRRNVLMTIAGVLTVAVSLFLVGSALLLRQGVGNATQQWEGGVEFAIYLHPNASASETEAVATELAESPEVADIRFLDKDEAYEEFQAIFRTSPELIDSVSPEVLPPSFRVVPVDKDPEAVEGLGARYEARPGVRQVVFAKDVVEDLLTFSRVLQLAFWVVAAVLLAAAALLIVNTIRLAIFARRREIEVMKLVGATNWFIRVPFMLEGMVAGLVGAGAAFGFVYAIRNVAQSRVADIALFEQFSVSSGEVAGTGVFMIAMGALVGAVGSGVAVTRFLDV